MAVIKSNVTKNFTMLKNKLLNDENLSFKARGLLSFMLSLPPDWKFYSSELVNHSKKDGKDSISAAIKELKANGYLEIKRITNDKGKYAGTEWSVYDYPKFKNMSSNPQPENPHTEKPHVENPQLQSTYSTNTNITNKDDDDKKDFEIRQKIMQVFQENIASVSSSIVSEQLNDWINTVGADLVMRAIEAGIENSAHSFKWINSTLSDWQKKNIKTVEQANAYMADHDKKKKYYSNKNTNQNKRGVESEEYGW